MKYIFIFWVVLLIKPLLNAVDVNAGSGSNLSRSNIYVNNSATRPPLPFIVLPLGQSFTDKEKVYGNKLTQNGMVLLHDTSDESYWVWKAGQISKIQSPIELTPSGHTYENKWWVADINSKGEVVGVIETTNPLVNLPPPRSYNKLPVYWPTFSSYPQLLRPYPETINFSLDQAYNNYNIPVKIAESGTIYGALTKAYFTLFTSHINKPSDVVDGLIWNSASDVPLRNGSGFAFGSGIFSDFSITQVYNKIDQSGGIITERVTIEVVSDPEESTYLSNVNFYSQVADSNFHNGKVEKLGYPLYLFFDLLYGSRIDEFYNLNNFSPVLANKTNRLIGFNVVNPMPSVFPIYWKDPGTSLKYLTTGVPLSLNNSQHLLVNGMFDTAKLWLWQGDSLNNFEYIERDLNIGGLNTWQFSASTMNDDLLILGRGTKLQINERSQPLLLVPAELAVDANRDGVITLSGDLNAEPSLYDQTSQSNPYHFWSNDDDDGIFSNLQETEQDDLEVINTQREDWRNNVIDVTRDLEDFARLNLHIGGLQDAFKNGQLYLGLKWADTNGTNPAIKLYRSTDTVGETNYLNDPSAANRQAVEVAIVDARHPAYSGPPWASDHTVIGTGDFFVLPTLQSVNLSAENPTLKFIFEGCTTGKGQLKLVILKKENGNYTEIGEGPGVWMDIKKPHEFIQRWTSGDGSLGPVEPVRFDATKSGTFAAPTKDEEKDLVLYVHGYNMQADWEKQRWIEATYKRLYWLGYKGRVGGFTWPCVLDDGSKFDASEELAWKAGAELRNLLTNLKGQGYRVHVVAHSMGNVVMGEALRLAGANSELVTTYVASQAAIAAHTYDTSLPDRTDFTPITPNVYGRYWAAGQSASLPATWGSQNPSYLAPTYIQGAAGKFVNFYNPQDWALMGNGINILPNADDGSQTGWMTDQRLKPNFGYDYISSTGFVKEGFMSPTYLTFPTDRFTIFPYCAEARSLALGATSTGGVFAGSEVNLFDAPHNFRNQHIYHSAQFRSYYAQRWQYWQALMDECNLRPRTKP